MKHECKVIWVYLSENIEHCPVRLTEKYLSLCPAYYVKSNFYLQSLSNTKPFQWYAEQVVGQCSLAKVVKKLLSDGKIDRYFTNHSLRRSAPTRLFQAGVDRKMVKEITGHRSDAIDCYQVTSDRQKMHISEIIAGKKSEDKTVVVKQNEVKANPNDGLNKLSDESNNCQCHSILKCDDNNVAAIIDQIVKAQKGKGKTVIKLEIQISNE